MDWTVAQAPFPRRKLDVPARCRRPQVVRRSRAGGRPLSQEGILTGCSRISGSAAATIGGFAGMECVVSKPRFALAGLVAGSLMFAITGCQSGDRPGAAPVSQSESEAHIPGKTAPIAGPGGKGQPGSGMPGGAPTGGGGTRPPSFGGSMPGGGGGGAGGSAPR